MATLKDNKGYCMTTEEEAEFDDAFFGNEEEDSTTRQQGGTGEKPRRRRYAKISVLFGVDAKGTNGQWVSKKTGKSAIQ